MKPHQYQTNGVEFALQTRICYWMVDMGLGKTLMTLMLQDRTKGKFLVVAPLRPLYSTWTAEIEKWFPNKRYAILHGKGKDEALREDADFYLINPEGFKWLATKQNLPFDNLIIDEGSMWKASNTKRFRILRKMLPQFKYRVILSGTPSPQGLMDLWSQYYILDGGQRLGRNITAFRNQYFNTFLVNGQFPKYTPKLGALEAVMEKVSDITFRLDANDYIELPELLYNRISLKLPQSLRTQYKMLENDFVLEMESYEVEAFNSASLSSKLRQFVQGGIYEGEGRDRITHFIHNIRVEALKELIEETGQPILCSIQFRFELEMLRKEFPDAPYIGGGVKPEEGHKIIQRWNRKEIPLLICHPKALSHGANLQTGGHIILWYGLTWSLEQYQQLIARLYRQGQKHGVVVHHFVMEGTIDEAVEGALLNKRSVQQAVLDYAKERS